VGPDKAAVRSEFPKLAGYLAVMITTGGIAQGLLVLGQRIIRCGALDVDLGVLRGEGITFTQVCRRR
jgi:hypothetical protein